jgi:ABC-2 type transport system permease protein
MVVSGRTLRQIDFILPGMIGFSLLNAGIFATAFAFLTLRQTLVIKRFFTTPVSRFSIIFGESLSRLIVSLLQASIIIGTGYFAFHFTLIHGFWTLLSMLGLSAIGLIIFLGFGLIISSVAKDDRTVAPMAQLVTLPQFLLAGTFFPIDQLPNWLQKIANLLPLTYLNDAMRKVAFEGASFTAIRMDLLWLLVWGVAIYIVTIRVFRWEAQ